MDWGGNRAVHRLADCLKGLVIHLDPGAGWYAEFLRRDPEGLRTCLEGGVIPPWDVVESLLQDLAVLRGEEWARDWTAAVARLRADAVVAYDQQPGAVAELTDQRALAEAQRAASETAMGELSARLRATTDPAETDRLTRELSWTEDDFSRAAARCAEFAARLAAAVRGRAEAGGAHPAEVMDAPTAPPRWFRAYGRAPRPTTPGGRLPAQRGARFAGAPDGGAGPAPQPTPFPEFPQAGPVAAPRGARFGGEAGRQGTVPDAAPESGRAPGPGRAPARPEPAAGRAVAALVGELTGLRAQGRSGEAHVLLCEAAGWPPDRLPPLAAELERAGLGADWATLLWEAASLPPARLSAVAAALDAAGRPADGGRLLREGVARPAAEIADAALALTADGRDREAGALLGAFVRVRAPEEAARLARTDPSRLAPRLLAAARGVSERRHRELVHALRVAGVPMP